MNDHSGNNTTPTSTSKASRYTAGSLMDMATIPLFLGLALYLAYTTYGDPHDAITLPKIFISSTVVFSWISWWVNKYRHCYMLVSLVSGLLITMTPYKDVVYGFFDSIGYPVTNTMWGLLLVLVGTCLFSLIMLIFTRKKNAMRLFRTVMICGVCVAFLAFHYIVIDRAMADQIAMKNDVIGSIAKTPDFQERLTTYCEIEKFTCEIGSYDDIGNDPLVADDPQTASVHEFSKNHPMLLHTWNTTGSGDDLTLKTFMKVGEVAAIMHDNSQYGYRVRHFMKTYLLLSTLFFMVWSSALLYLIPKHARVIRSRKSPAKTTST
jgi:hypothetical protein